MNVMAVSSSSLGLALHFNPKRGGAKAQQTVIWAMKLAPILLDEFVSTRSVVCRERTGEDEEAVVYLLELDARKKKEGSKLPRV
jgi:hypothetical protein